MRQPHAACTRPRFWEYLHVFAHTCPVLALPSTLFCHRPFQMCRQTKHRVPSEPHHIQCVRVTVSRTPGFVINNILSSTRSTPHILSSCCLESNPAHIHNPHTYTPRTHTHPAHIHTAPAVSRQCFRSLSQWAHLSNQKRGREGKGGRHQPQLRQEAFPFQDQLYHSHVR